MWLVHALIAAVLVPGTGSAAERLDARYVMTWKGLEVGRFEARLAFDDAGYRVGYRAETVGIVAWLFPFTSAGASEGGIGDGLIPARHVGESRRRNGRSAWTVRFDDEGAAHEVEVTTTVDEQREPVPAELRRAPDPLSLALHITDAAAPGVRLEEHAFDGKRAIRFELACAEQEEAVDDAALAPRVRTALRCTLDGDLAGGRSRRWASSRDEERKPAVILLSREIAPGRYWPLRVTADTRFGPVVVDLTEHR